MMQLDKVQRYERVYAEISLDEILNNLKELEQNIDKNTRIMAVVKTDAYGHGAVEIAKQLEECQVIYGYGVATAEEAHILRESGIKKPILILGYTFPKAYPLLVKEDIRPAVFRDDVLEEMNRAAKENNKKWKIHIKVDTGMNRIGIKADESGESFIRRLSQYPFLEVEGIFTHFAKSDEVDLSATWKQLKTFSDFVIRTEGILGYSIPIKHCSNSAGIHQMAAANMNMVRAGISLYGIYPSKEVGHEIVLNPVMSLYSQIVYIKTLSPGESISYGGTFTTNKTMRIATIPVGYGDGYPRSLSNKGYVLIHRKRAAILGRICMDQFMVDVTNIPEAKEGDKVTLMGKNQQEFIGADILGDLSGRFHYELLCDFGKRIPRVYVKEGRIIGVKDYFEDFM